MNYLDGSRILITGASGFIGKNLLERLHSNPCIHLRCVDRKSGDLKDPNFCNYVTSNIDIVFHCAANSSGIYTAEKDHISLMYDNTIMNMHMLEKAYDNKVKKFVWLASTTGYPELDTPVMEDQLFEGTPHKSYAAVGEMKRYIEKVCKLFSERTGRNLPCVVLRPSNIYGPHDKLDPKRSHVLTALICKFLSNTPDIEIWGDGEDQRDVLYISDLIDAMLIATEVVNTYNPINIAYGKSFSIIELFNIIKKILQDRRQFKLVAGMPRAIPKRLVSIQKAKNLLGWSPKIDIEDGIRKSIEWINTNS